jgi:hypothetical protein
MLCWAADNRQERFAQDTSDLSHGPPSISSALRNVAGGDLFLKDSSNYLKLGTWQPKLMNPP